MTMWSVLLPGLALLLAAGAWYSGMAARERANAAAGKLCSEQGITLLDGTVALTRLRLTRLADGQVGIRRTYVVDYSSDGFNRATGFVVMCGNSVESLGL